MPRAKTEVAVESVQKGERYRVESQFSPRGDWKVESNDAVLSGAIQTARGLSESFKNGTAKHRVYDNKGGVVVWERGHIEEGIKRKESS